MPFLSSKSFLSDTQDGGKSFTKEDSRTDQETRNLVMLPSPLNWILVPKVRRVKYHSWGELVKKMVERSKQNSFIQPKYSIEFEGCLYLCKEASLALIYSTGWQLKKFPKWESLVLPDICTAMSSGHDEVPPNDFMSHRH